MHLSHGTTWFMLTTSHWLWVEMMKIQSLYHNTAIRAHFQSFARSKLRLCSANHRPGYWSNLPCDWLSTAWARDRKWALVFVVTSECDLKFLNLSLWCFVCYHVILSQMIMGPSCKVGSQSFKGYFYSKDINCTLQWLCNKIWFSGVYLSSKPEQCPTFVVDGFNELCSNKTLFTNKIPYYWYTDSHYKPETIVIPS